MGVFAYIVVMTLLSCMLVFFLRRKRIRNPKQRAKLPPGSMGWPYIGETLQLYSQNPNDFFSSKQKRYGEIFKTHILGCPCVMLASPEAARFVLELMIGPSALFFHQGDYHSHLRKLVKSSLSPDSIRNHVSHIESVVLSTLDSWDGCGVINTFQEMKKFSFDIGIVSIFGDQLNEYYKKELKKNYAIVDKGYNSFPTNIPGTSYHNAVLARKRLDEILSEIITARKEKKLVGKDLLGSLMNSRDENGQALTDNQIADNIIGVLFAAQDTTASILTWTLKFLHDDPKLLEAVKGDQKAIYESNDKGIRPLTWTQTRNMVLTYKVILESLRMASIISFTFREAVTDVEYKGYRIPKGWKVMPLFRNIQHNPEFFSDPQKFDPSRFEVAPKPNTFMPFGTGVHACPGNELAKLEILIFIYHLVNKYRWEVVGSHSGIQYAPFPVPQHGLPAMFRIE
ncbi:hypothetical protein MKX01_005922 [Papaver californicum]|nr:hypothetical protein MKX01_005922 [Papaver californicum]